jgi:ribose transport system permease protein
MTPDQTTTLPAAPRPSLAARLLVWPQLATSIVLLMLLLVMVVSPQRGAFLSPGNLQNIALQTSLLGIFAIGETIVIITGGIDLSLGSLLAFTSMLLALFVTTLDQRMFTGAAIALGIALTLFFALCIGFLHATLIHKLRLPPFVVTLVSLLVLRSQSYLMNHEQQIPLYQNKYPFFDWLTNGKLFAGTPLALPIPTVILIVVAAIVSIVLNRTRMGRYLYSIGNNEQATTLSGVNTFRVKLFAYGVSALLGCVAGILYAGRGHQGDPQIGVAYELDAVAASVVGGASLTGGRGSVAGTVIGALLLYSISTSINLTLNNQSWRETVVGAVLMLAVLISALQQRNQRTRKG